MQSIIFNPAFLALTLCAGFSVAIPKCSSYTAQQGQILDYLSTFKNDEDTGPLHAPQHTVNVDGKSIDVKVEFGRDDQNERIIRQHVTRTDPLNKVIHFVLEYTLNNGKQYRYWLDTRNRDCELIGQDTHLDFNEVSRVVLFRKIK